MRLKAIAYDQKYYYALNVKKLLHFTEAKKFKRAFRDAKTNVGSIINCLKLTYD